jgi:hypothetical protein
MAIKRHEKDSLCLLVSFGGRFVCSRCAIKFVAPDTRRSPIKLTYFAKSPGGGQVFSSGAVIFPEGDTTLCKFPQGDTWGHVFLAWSHVTVGCVVVARKSPEVRCTVGA